MDNLGDNLRTGLDQARVGRRQVRTANGISRGIFNKEGQEREDAAHEERDDEEVDDDEYEIAFPHC